MKKIYSCCLSLLGFLSVSLAQTVIPASDELVLPQYAYYGGTRAANRLPVVCRLKLTGLTPGATYRYFTGMSSNASATAQTPGNMYRINNGVSASGYGHITGFAVTKAINSTEINNDEMRTDNISRHARFTADGSGSYTGWFACVPVGNAAQQANGSDVYFYVQMNDGATGTALNKSYRTTSTIRLLDYSSVSGNAAGGTALLGTSDVSGEKMVTIYDNTSANGRPLYCTFTENNSSQGGALSEGTLWTNPVIYPAVDGVNGSWAAIIPNSLSGGVKAIHFFNIDGSAVALSNAPSANTSADGKWNDVSTANPAGDSTAPIIINSIANSALPLSLLSFNGEAAKEGVRLYWKTTQEINNKFFEISRAGNDGRFQIIGKVNAAATPDLTNAYSFVDRQPNAGKNYYQLKQVDKDGRAKLYNTIFVNTGKQNQAIRLISISGSEVAVAIQAVQNTNGSILYADIQGRVLYSRTISLQPGENIIRIPDAGVSNGMGVISFISNTERMNLKVIR